MEALSPTMEEGQVVTWLKAEGDAVAQGDILAEIETDKATMELVARGEGVLRRIFVAEGATAPVGDVIAVIGAEDEDIAALVASAGPATAPAATAAEPAATGAGPAAQAEPAAQAGPAAAAAEPRVRIRNGSPVIGSGYGRRRKRSSTSISMSVG